jgi:hypothetical protein
MIREGWYLPKFEQQRVDRATAAGESYEPASYWSLRPLTGEGVFIALVLGVPAVGGGSWTKFVNGQQVPGSHGSPEAAASWAERGYLNGKPPTGEKVKEIGPWPEPGPLRIQAADKALRERKLSAEERALLRLAWFWE